MARVVGTDDRGDRAVLVGGGHRLQVTGDGPPAGPYRGVNSHVLKPPALPVDTPACLCAGLRTTIPKIGLLGRFTLLSLVATVVLGVGLGDLVTHEIRARALRSAAQSAHLVATFGLQVQLSYTDLEQGPNPETIQSLDLLFLSGYQAGTLAQVEVINTHRRVIYSNNHSLIGQDLPRGRPG